MEQPDPPKRRRRHRGARKRFFSRLSDAWKRWSQTQTSASVILLSFLVAAPALAMGAVHLWVLATIASIGFLAILIVDRTHPMVRGPAVVCLAISGYCTLQSVPMPFAWLEALSPHNAEVWRESLLLADGHAPRLASLSIDPGASLREALKWAFYATVLLVASRVSQQHSLPRVLMIVFSSALCVALLTALHGVFGAERVYGFYERSFQDSQWALSPLINMNNLAGYLNLGVFSGLALALRARPAQRSALMFGIALLMGLSLTSGSRGAAGTLLLGVASCGVFHAFRADRRNLRAIAASSTVCAMVFIAMAVLVLSSDLGEAALRGLDDKNMDKLRMLEWTAPLISDHLWFGVGAGAFETGFSPYRALDDGVIWTHPENFLLGWLAEFGLPVVIFLFVAFAYRYWRRRAEPMRGERTFAWIAVAMWFLHNLVDLAVTVPGVFAAPVALLGALARPTQSNVQIDKARPIFGPQMLTPALCVAGVALCVAALWKGQPNAAEDRQEIGQLLRQENLTNEDQRQRFLNRLREAIRRHPGDEYLFRAGAIAMALDPEHSALPWLGRALDRDLMNGPTHFLLAHELARRGSISQALLQLRLTVERSPYFAQTVAQRLLTWTMKEGELRTAIPKGAAGAPVLLELAQRLPLSSHLDLRERFLREAFPHHKNPDLVRTALVRDLLWRWRHQPETCAQRPIPCQIELRSHLDSLSARSTLPPQETARRVQLEADWAVLAGKPEQAVKTLLENCPPPETACTRQAVALSAKYDLPLKNVTRHYLLLACPDEETCPEAHRAVGAAYASKAAWTSALAHQKQAAELSNTAGDVITAAKTALKAQRGPEGLHLLSRLESSIPRPTPEERSAAERLKTAITEDETQRVLDTAGVPPAP